MATKTLNIGIPVITVVIILHLTYWPKDAEGMATSVDRVPDQTAPS